MKKVAIAKKYQINLIIAFLFLLFLFPLSVCAERLIHNVPYISQINHVDENYKYIDESACAPTSLAMLIKYYYPNSCIDMPEIYHSGMQLYSYRGPAKGYRNVSWASGWGSQDPGLNHPEIEEEFRQYFYEIGDPPYSGNRGNEIIKNYLKNIWDINSITFTSVDDVYNALRTAPLMGHVYGEGNLEWGHYLVIIGFDDRDTVDRSDDIIIVNDPYNLWEGIYSNGDDKEITYTAFFGSGTSYGYRWFRDALQLIPVVEKKERDFTIVVDSGNSFSNGNYSLNKFQVDNVDDRLESNDQAFTWHFYYGVLGDWFYPREENHTAKWTPAISTSGDYKVAAKFRSDSESGNVTYKIFDSNDVLLESKTINQYNQFGTYVSVTISENIHLNSGCYVVADNISANSNIDAIEFRYLPNQSYNEKNSWFFNESSIQDWQGNGFSDIVSPNDRGWLELVPLLDPKLISPYLSIETNPSDPNEAIDLIQIFGRNNSQDNIGEIFIKTNLNGNYIQENSLPFTFPNDNRWHLIQINVHDIQGWDESSRIHGIRIDPIKTVNTSVNETIYIDYIRLRKKKAFFNTAHPDVKWHPDGAFLKSASNSSVYLIERGKKRPVSDGTAFEAYSYDWTNIITASDAELACYPDGAPIPSPMSIDRVIRRAGVDEHGNPYPKFYLVTGTDTVKRHISSKKVADLGIDLLVDVEEVSNTELNGYDEGPEITTIYPEGTIIKSVDSPGVFIISNGEARLFSSQVTFEKLGYSTDDDDNDGLPDSAIEVKFLPKIDSAHMVNGDRINTCGGGNGCVPEITWPLGGETLIGGTSRETTYRIPCPDNVSSVVFSCTIDGYITETIINTNAPKNSVQTWHIPDVATDKASVQITAYDIDGRPYSASPETFITIESNTVPGQDYFDIYNEGGEPLTVSEITLENNLGWITLNNNAPLPPATDSLVIGANSSLRIPVDVNKSGLSSGIHTDTIHVVSDDPDPDHQDMSIAIELNVKAENSAPGAPLSPDVTPEGWSGSNTYSIQWTDPDDLSGIVGGHYKIGAAPSHNTDGVYFDISEKPLQIYGLSDGNYQVYIWLKDGLGNIDFNNHEVVTVQRDTTSPQIVQLSPLENTIDMPVHTAIACSVSDQFSGVDAGNIVMSINGSTVVPQEISANGDNLWVEYQPDTNFNFDEMVTVYLKMNDTSDPVNYVEKTYTFNTFSYDGDADGDGLTNGDEYSHGTDPLNSDSDFDGMADGWEVDNGLEPSSGEGINGPDGDIDGDGLTNILEYLDGLYYMADPVTIVDAPVGTVTENSFTIHIAGDGVVAYKYKFNDDSWQPETTVDIPIELVDLPDGMCSISVIGMDQNGYWQSTGSVTLASWVVEAAPSRYSLSNGYIYLSGTDGYLDELKVDPAGAGNYGQNIINANGRIDWLINGSTFSNINTTIQIQEQNRIVLNNQAGALWDINLNGAQFTSSLNIAYAPTNVQVSVDMPYEDSGYFDYAQRYHWEYNNNHDATDIPFKTFYSQTGNTRTIEYFMRNNDDGNYMQFRTNLWDDTQGEPASGNNRLIAIGTGIFDIDFNNLPSHRIWMDKTSDTLTLCSGQDTNVQTINFDFEVTQFDENEGIDVNENGDKMPYFYTSDNEAITNAYGGEYTFDELLNRFYRQSAFYYTDVGLNIWWNWASQYTGFVNNWYRNKLKANLETWEQGDDGYGHSGYMWSWPGNREWPMGNLYLTYDFRFLNTNALFIQAVWNYYAWTGDDAFLGGQLQRLRDAMQYQLDWLGGGSEQIINGDNNYDSDHGGIHNEDVGTNYWDIMPFGGKDAYCSIDFYKSLEALARIEYTLGNTTEGDSYTTMAEQAKTAYNATFWSTTTNRYIGAIDRLDNIHDYGFSFVNIEALAAGLGDPSKVDQIYNWLDSGDIYDKWNFAPRTNVETTQNLWRIPNNNGYVWEQQLQDGGANLYVSGYDVIARAKYINADDAYDRLKAVLARYSEPDKLTGGSPTIFNETIQGGSDGAGSLGVMSHEFPESGIAGSSFLYAFIGLSPQWDGLHIDPKLPSGQAYIGAKNINYHGMNLNVHIEPGLITIACTKNEDIGDSYYVVNGSRELFPTGPFTIEIYNSDLNNDGDVDGRDIAELCEQIELGLIANPQNAISSFANRFGWLK